MKILSIQIAASSTSADKNSYEPVPKLSDLYHHSPDFSDEVNERARKAALKEIAAVKERNKKAASDRKTAGKEFVEKDLSDFGIPKDFAAKYAKFTLKYLKRNPSEFEDYCIDPAKVTEKNLIAEMVKKAKADGEDNPVHFVAMEVFLNPGDELENAKLDSYFESLQKLNPAVRKRAKENILKQMVAMLKI